MNGDPDGGRRGALFPFVPTPARFVRTIRDTASFVRRRREARSALRPYRARWAQFLLLVLFLIAFSALTFDVALARFARDPEAMYFVFNQELTEWASSMRILVPAGSFLFITLFIDWKRLSGDALALWANWSQSAWFVFLSVGGASIAVNILKVIFGRARPPLSEELGTFSFHPFTIDWNYASFPSGHSTNAGAFWMALGLLMPSLRIPFFIIALWSAGSRIVLGVHHVSDVIAGLSLGGWFAYFVATRFARSGLLFVFRDGGRLSPRESYHVLPWDMHRRVRRFLRRLRARLLAGRERARAWNARI